MRKVIAAAKILLAILTIASLVACYDSEENSGGDTSKKLPIDSVVIEIAGADSISVFELTRKDYTVIYESSRFGVFVKAIDGKHIGGNHFWIYTVNDTAQNIAADKYITRDGDKIVWHLRRITK